ncbi:MAG: NADH-quinone oxidoreductase subunit J [Phycisphaeraceae bacterium]|nr:NADH-quinone oxidoreductase subunit J [Phycisphaeraceae bacterium]
MEQVIGPVILYTLLALGAVGVCMALPRRGVSPQIIGAVIAAAAGGLVIVALSLKAAPAIPNVYFYIFSVISLGAALRVITHPRPVYAALYFILTVLSTAGMFVILGAEFLAFALIIVYAGAILITYLFVIMLATQAPTGGDTEILPEYDAVSREPIAATLAGFVLLGVLTTLMFRGLPNLPPPGKPPEETLIVRMPGKVETALRNAGLMKAGEKLDRNEQTGAPAIDLAAGVVRIVDKDGVPRAIERKDWPAGMKPANIEGVGFSLLADHPGAIEIAGVILLMAMLGAVVLARKQVELDEEAKARHAAKLSAETEGV